MSEFVHLHVHSEYSLRESTLRIADSVRLCALDGMEALAITDTNALYGAIPFYNTAKEQGVRPIIGVQLNVCRDEDDPLQSNGGPAHRIQTDTAVLLATDFSGYQDLVRLVTQAHRRVRRPCVTFSELAKHRGSIVALVGGGESIILRAFGEGHSEDAEKWLRLWKSTMPQGDLYADIQDHAVATERKGLPAFVRWARANGVLLVATNDVHYASPEDADIQRILAQMETHGEVRTLEGDKYHFASPDEMLYRFSKLPEAAHNTLVVAERCNLVLPQTKPLLPRYPTTTGEEASVVLRKAAEVGARQRYGHVDGSVRERLDYELSVIEGLGFSDYFLVVADFIRFAHRNGISTGPGRGSAASSLVAYALRITDVDPLRHKLLFERFLNPERVSWPDIDTDFEFERRGEVIQYVVDRYGMDYVAQIGTFGTLAAKAAIRDVGRVLQTETKIVDALARQIPSVPGITMDRALREVEGLAAWIDANPGARTLWDTATKLEGLPRHTSTHAAGVLIAPVPITDLTPTQPGGDGIPVTQYPMEIVEQLGLMKMDFLGLRTLTLIDRCVASIEAHTGQKLDWRAIGTDDAKTYQMLSRGEADGCFQLESAGVKRVLRDLKPSRFDDLVAVTSLYRPGPMENIPAFIAAKHGKAPIHYPHPDLEPILADTYGVIVYQEQIMQIASKMAGFSLGQADILRRAVGKKKREVLDGERARFVSGCVAKGYDEETANHVYDLIVRFADYGFPLSHASAYAVLAYRTAYLRANWFAHFTAALLTMTAGDENKTRSYIRDARQHRIEVRLPSIVHSEAEYTVESDGHIRTGLLSVRNVGRGAVDAILVARAEKPFTSLVDFLQRVNQRVCNRRAVESLLTAGALSPFLPEGATPVVGLQMLEEAYQGAEAGKQPTGGLGLVFDEKAEKRVNGQQQRARGGSGVATDKGAASIDESVLFIRYDGRTAGRTLLHRVRQVLAAYPGPVPVALYNQANQSVRVLEDRWAVELRPELISSLEETVGIGNAKMGRRPAPSPRTSR